LPGGPWARTWLIALVIALPVLGGYEGFWRLRGFVPSVNDDADLWSLTRGTIRSHDTQEIVGIGASRLQLGMNPAVFAEAFGGRKPIQLAVDGSNCVPVLDHLSRDESFRGLVICDVTPRLIFEPVNTANARQAEYVENYRSQTALAAVERRLRTWVQASLVLRLPDVAPRQVLWKMKEGQLPSPNYLTTFVDRSKQADYTRADLAALIRKWESSYPVAGSRLSAEQFERDLQALEGMVERIQNRGGQVVFVAMPSSGTIRALEEKSYPRHQFWDLLAARTRAIAIHAADYPSLSRFHCPEGSHLDFRDAIPFTQNFASILKEKLREESSVTLETDENRTSRPNRIQNRR
jgi:hypothetical protein